MLCYKRRYRQSYSPSRLGLKNTPTTSLSGRLHPHLTRPSWRGLNNTPTIFLLRSKTHLTTPSRLELKKTLTAFLQKNKTHLTSILDMILNNLMVRAQYC